MSMYRENGSGTRPSTWKSDLVLTVVLVAAILGAETLAMHRDDQDEQQLREQAEAERVKQLMPMKVRDAYEQGMADAVESLKGTPQGMQLAQACMAAGMRPVAGGKP